MDNIHNQSNLTFIAEKLPENIYKDLYAYCEKRRDDQVWNFNWRLAGALNQQSGLNEHKYECPGLEQYLLSNAAKLWNEIYLTCPWEFNSTPDPTRFMKLHNLWVNYQKKGEYNPMHNHAGIASFAIFIDIPYGPDERDAHRSNGAFQLEAEVLPVDNSWNGSMLLFPATTNHAVYPYYTSDKERITVAGNITWAVEGPDEEHY